MRRIICIGSRFVAADAAGPLVFDRLAAAALPPGAELVDGGLRGIDLLPLVDGCEQVVFVDGVDGYGAAPGDVVLLDAAAAAEALAYRSFDHAAGLAYLLGVLPAVCERAVPDVRVVGIEGWPDEAAVRRAADLALRVAAAPIPVAGGAAEPRRAGGGGRHAASTE